jgi:hypothetical protein
MRLKIHSNNAEEVLQYTNRMIVNTNNSIRASIASESAFVSDKAGVKNNFWQWEVLCKDGNQDQKQNNQVRLHKSNFIFRNKMT